MDIQQTSLWKKDYWIKIGFQGQIQYRWISSQIQDEVDGPKLLTSARYQFF